MAHRIRNRYRTSLRDAEQREAFEAGAVHHRFEIADERLERNLFDIAVRQAVAARIVADQGMVARQLAIKVPPNRTLEIEFEKLSKSNSRWVIQFPVFTSGGPLPMLE